MRTLALLPLLILISTFSFSQTNKPYTEGPVWNLSMIKVKPGFGDIYLKNLSEGWYKIMKQAKQDGLISDFKIISAPAGHKDDWDLLLMTQVKNFAAMDGIDSKFEALQAKLLGNEETMQKAAFNRNDMREPLGEKLGQELIFK